MSSMKLSRAFFIGCLIMLAQAGNVATCKYEYTPPPEGNTVQDQKKREQMMMDGLKNAWHLPLVRLNLPDLFPVSGNGFPLTLQVAYLNSSSTVRLWTVHFYYNDTKNSSYITKYDTSAMKGVNISTRVFLVLTNLLCIACICSSIVSVVKQEEYEKINAPLFGIHWLFLIISCALYTVYAVNNVQEGEQPNTSFGYGIYMIWTAFFFSVVAIIFTACVVTAYMDRFERAYMFQDKEKEKKEKEKRDKEKEEKKKEEEEKEGSGGEEPSLMFEPSKTKESKTKDGNESKEPSEDSKVDSQRKSKKTSSGTAKTSKVSKQSDNDVKETNAAEDDNAENESPSAEQEDQAGENESAEKLSDNEEKEDESETYKSNNDDSEIESKDNYSDEASEVSAKEDEEAQSKQPTREKTKK
ncbi:uncharacterized protein LOC142349832 isoform X2 [Convolutriloba macropyga]|uniref:uncharacterized protein LOC142349832 isoform X2 n=1 Tax=Convolutriloba macropyga TaxID=536237 RepID=UPI003F526014